MGSIDCRGDKNQILSHIEGWMGSEGKKEYAEKIYTILRKNTALKPMYILVFEGDSLLSLVVSKNENQNEKYFNSLLQNLY